MSEAIRAAYEGSAVAWRQGPAPFYARLAEALLDHAHVPLAGATVLDAGAGSGVVGAASRARGAARVVAVDLAAAMLPADGASVAADLARLPFRDAAFDLAVAGFSLGHLTTPVPVLREMRRVAPALLASAFAEGWTHPAKEVVERLLAERGYLAPAWYRALKEGSERAVAAPERLRDLAVAAGYRADVATVEVATGLAEPDALVAWRLGMAQHAPFVESLPAEAREAVRREAARLLVGAPSVVVPVLVLSAT